MSQTTTIARGIERAVKYALGGASYEDMHSLLAQVRAGRQDLAPILADALEDRGMHHDPETLWHLRSGDRVYEHRTKSGRYAFRPWPRLTLSDIRRINRESGGHFFSPSAARFFGSRPEKKIHQGSGGTYFVDSIDNFDRTGRHWKVRRFDHETGEVAGYVNTPGQVGPGTDAVWFPDDFGSAEAAHAAAAHLAAHGRLPLPYRPERMARKGKPQRYNHGAFYQQIARSHGDALPQLVYADWLDENGFSGEAEIMRRDGLARQQSGSGRYINDASKWLSSRIPAGESPFHVDVYNPEHPTPDLRLFHYSPDRSKLMTYSVQLPPEEITRVVGSLHPATSKHHLVAQFEPRQERMKRGGKPARLARQVPMYSAEHLHPELRFTRLGAVLRQIASDDPDPTSEHLDPVISLARHIIDHSGPHDAPMDLLGLSVLRDYLVETPGHDLAKRFNWDKLPEKIALDRTVRGMRHPRHEFAHLQDHVLGHGYYDTRDAIQRLRTAHPWVTTQDIKDSIERVGNQEVSRGVIEAPAPDAGHTVGHWVNMWHDAARDTTDDHMIDHGPQAPERYDRKQVSGVANALRLLRSRNQQQTRAVAGQVLQSLGLVPATVRDAVSTGPAPVASVLASVPTGGDDDKGEAAAAYLGHLLQLPAVTAFHTKPDGPDAVHRFTLPHPPDTAANILAKFNLARAAISPSGGGTDVVVHDPGTKLTAAVRQAASGQPVKSVRGTSVSFGHSQGHRADAGARKTYRDVMAAWEDKAGGKVQMRRGGKPVRYSHESFGKAMLKNRADTLPPLVYADWLEENGQTAHGEVVRRHLQERGNRGYAVNDYKPNVYIAHRFPAGVVTADTWIGPNPGEMAVEVGYSHPVDNPDDRAPVRRVSHHIHLPAAEAHALLLRLHDEGVAGAREAAAEVRRLYQHIPRPERMARKPDPLTHRNLFPDEQEAVNRWQSGTVDRFRTELALALANRRGFFPTKRELKSLAEIGSPAKGSYSDSGKAMQMLIRSPGDAHRWVVLNSILSAQTPWVTHTEGATAVLALWHRIRDKYMKLGEKGRENLLNAAFGTTHQPGGKGNPVLDPSKPRMLKFATMYGGQKAAAVKRFFANHPVGDYLLGRSDVSKSMKTGNFGASYFDPRGFAVDTHMVRPTVPRELMDKVFSKSFYAGKLPEVREQLEAAHDKLNGNYNASVAYKLLGLHAADEMGWEPREVQEAAWAGILATMLAKYHGTGNDPHAIMAFLPKDAVRESWDMGHVLKKATMLGHLEGLGAGPKEVKEATTFLTDTRPRPTGNVETSDPEALGSVAKRLPAEVQKAAGMLNERIKSGPEKLARRRKRPSDSPAFVALVRLLLDAGGLTQGEGVERFARDGRPELYGKKVAVKLKELKPWLAAIALAPHDRVTRGAFSDWLEERGLHHDDLTLHHLQLHDGPVFAMRHPRSGKVVAMPGRQVTSLEGLREHMAANGMTRPISPDGLEDFEFFHGPGGIAVLHRASDTGHHGVSLFAPDGRPLVGESRSIGDDGYRSYGDPRPHTVARRHAMRHAFGV